MHTRTDEIADGMFRLSTSVPDAPLVFNQFLLRADEPLLFHTGFRGAVSARLGGSRASCPSIRCAGSRSVTSRATSAAR